MVIKQRKFPRIRVWQLTCRLRELAGRNIVNTRPVQRRWAYCAKRQYQAMLLKAEYLLPCSRGKTLSYDWQLSALESSNVLMKVLENTQKTWQHRAYEILEALNKLDIKVEPKMAREWLICAQVVTSHNHFLKRNSTIDSTTSSWQRAVWRSAGLNRLKACTNEKRWQYAYALIAKYNFRTRRIHWGKAANRIVVTIR